MCLDLKNAYLPEANLAALTRTVTLHRESPWVELVDDVTFESEKGTFESVLITFGDVTIEPDIVCIQTDGAALHIHYDPAVVAARAEIMKDVDLAIGPRDIIRVIFALVVPAQTAQVRLRMLVPSPTVF